jgi:hypothetical protein
MVEIIIGIIWVCLIILLFLIAKSHSLNYELTSALKVILDLQEERIEILERKND